MLATAKSPTMPRKKIPPQEGGFASEILAGAEAGAAMQPRPNAISSDHIRERGVPAIRPSDSLEMLTARIGARFWATNKRFDWALRPDRHHYEFTRWYFQQHVLVDVWANSNASSRKECAHKKACVDAENVRRAQKGEAPIGYLPVVRGALIAEEAFERVLRGETLELIERAVEGVLI